MPSFRSFLTGSRVYGMPNADSDVDLVVFVTEEDLEQLHRLAIKLGTERDHRDSVYIEDENYRQNTGSFSVRFGKLNLICVTDEKWYQNWLRGTKYLKERRPVSRIEATDYFKMTRVRDGLKPEEK